MKKLLTFLFIPLLIVLFISCKAQENSGEKSLLWRISGHGLSKPSYLFGTIHMICPDDYFWTNAMQKSLSACSKVCFEMDMDDPSVLMGASSMMTDTNGKLLRDYFTPGEYARLKKFVQDSIGLNLEQLQNVKPVVLQSLFMSKAAGCAIPISYEANIMAEAMKSKKEIIGLESLKEQMDVFNSLADDSIIHDLVQIPDSFSEGKTEYAKLLAAYKAQDLPALYNIITNSKELGSQLGVFLDDRNQKWIPRMERQMKLSPVFFAVGAGHLVSSAGVISLLRNAGYTVSPVH